jgi:hypothetical protein
MQRAGGCGLWGLRAPARCSTVPAGTIAASKGSRLKLTVVRRIWAGHAFWMTGLAVVLGMSAAQRRSLSCSDLLGLTLLPLATVLAIMTNVGRARGGVVP